MSDPVQERAKTIVVSAIAGWRKNKERFPDNGPGLDEAYEAWKSALLGRLRPLMLARPENYFADAEAQPNPTVRRVAFRKRLDHLLAEIGQRPRDVLRDKEAEGVFIVHGWDEPNRLRLKAMVRDDFGGQPVVMADAPAAAATLIEKLEALANQVKFVLVLWTLDDTVRDPKGQEKRQPRPNVLFEIGFLIGRMGRDHVCILAKGGVGPQPTDLSGVHMVPFKDNVEEINGAIRRELKAAGLLA